LIGNLISILKALTPNSSELVRKFFDSESLTVPKNYCKEDYGEVFEKVKDRLGFSRWGTRNIDSDLNENLRSVPEDDLGKI